MLSILAIVVRVTLVLGVAAWLYARFAADAPSALRRVGIAVAIASVVILIVLRIAIRAQAPDTLPAPNS